MGHFGPPGSGSVFPMRIRIQPTNMNADPGPDPQHWKYQRGSATNNSPHIASVNVSRLLILLYWTGRNGNIFITCSKRQINLYHHGPRAQASTPNREFFLFFLYTEAVQCTRCWLVLMVAEKQANKSRKFLEIKKRIVLDGIWNLERLWNDGKINWKAPENIRKSGSKLWKLRIHNIDSYIFNISPKRPSQASEL